MNHHVTTISDESFETEVIKSQTPVLVDFWAPWCGPCKAIAPILEEVAQQYVGRLKIAKLNVDDNPQAPQKYGVRGIPTLILFKEGEVKATQVGAISKNELAAFIDKNS